MLWIGLFLFWAFLALGTLMVVSRMVKKRTPNLERSYHEGAVLGMVIGLGTGLAVFLREYGAIFLSRWISLCNVLIIVLYFANWRNKKVSKQAL